MAEKRVRLLHTGGTLGMTGSPLEPGTYAAQLLDHVPELSRLADIEPRIVCNLDSSSIGPDHWSILAAAIAEDRERYDGFVLIHGTDTMAYTASALSFALDGLDRPVILTGAQRPLSALRTDARRNLADAVELATCDIPEVGICFDGLLLRGCRAVKADARHYRAFASPGVEPLVRLGTDIDVEAHVRRPQRPFLCRAAFEPRVDVLWIAPGITAAAVRHATNAPGLKGLVLAAFGVGTVPDNGLGDEVAAAIARGISVVVVTQWGGGVRLGAYKNSLVLEAAGAVPGGEMRVEAAVPKLMHALANFPDRDERREYLLRDCAGERT